MKVVVLHGDVPPDAAADDLDTMVQAEAVAAALAALGHQPILVPFKPDSEDMEATLCRISPGAAFNLVESVAGSTRRISEAPRLLETLGIPHTGSSADVILATTDKVGVKPGLVAAGVPTPDWFIPAGASSVDTPPDHRPLPTFPGPYIIKSIWEHASLGLLDDGVVATADELPAAFARRASHPGAPWFAERYVDGREFVTTLLATRNGEPALLAIAEMDFIGYPEGKPRILGYAAKWDASSFEYGHTKRRFVAAGAEPALMARLAEFALASWRAFDLRGYARLDFRVDSDGEPWAVDVNSNPCISPDSGFAAAAAHAGRSYTDMVRRILEDAAG